MLGTAGMAGVPARGLPKINSLVGRIFHPNVSASLLRSTSSKMMILLLPGFPS